MLITIVSTVRSVLEQHEEAAALCGRHTVPMWPAHPSSLRRVDFIVFGVAAAQRNTAAGGWLHSDSAAVRTPHAAITETTSKN